MAQPHAQAAQNQISDAYYPKDALGEAIKGTAVLGAGGLFISTVQNTLAKQNVGAMGIFTRSGGTIATFAAMGGIFEFTSCAAANLRQRNDAYNSAIGGFFSGSILGLRARSAPAMVGYGIGLAFISGIFTYTGGKLSGYDKDPSVDEYARKEHMRKNRRRPVEETVMELGEGRGVTAPGYAERRAQRIKENYGIDVPTATS